MPSGGSFYERVLSWTHKLEFLLYALRRLSEDHPEAVVASLGGGSYALGHPTLSLMIVGAISLGAWFLVSRWQFPRRGNRRHRGGKRASSKKSSQKPKKPKSTERANVLR